MLRTLLTGLVALASVVSFDQEAFARYCNNPNCKMCNRIFGPMAGYQINNPAQRNYVSSNWSGRAGGNYYSRYTAPTYSTAGTYTYSTPAQTTAQTARYAWRKVCVNGVCSWKRVLVSSPIGRQKVYTSYPASTTTVSYGSNGSYTTSYGSTGSGTVTSVSYGSTGAAATTSTFQSGKCTCINCTCGNKVEVNKIPNVGSQRAAEAKLQLEPTPQKVVDAMLRIAGVQEDDWVYDIGCGDGRIVNTAAADYGAKGVGIELNPNSVDLAIEKSEEMGVSDRVTILEADILKVEDYSKANVITSYLFPPLMKKWIDKNKDSLTPGTKLISWNHEWQGLEGVEKRIYVDDDGVEHWFFIWVA